MQQQQTYKILQDLGGRAQYKAIYKKMLEVNPTVYYNDGNRPLRRLKKSGTIKYDAKNMEWFIPT